MSRGSGAGLSRSSPMKRSTKPMARRSAKQKAKYAGPDGRAAFVARILAERPHCEAGPLLWPCGINVRAYASGRRLRRVGDTWVLACSGRSEHVHEPHRRGAGGAIDDEANSVAVCPYCHDRIHCHVSVAEALGLLVSRYPPTQEPLS